MTQFTFYKDAALKFGSTFVSDHGRSPLQISYERIADEVRTQRGFLRRYYRADKRTVSCSWSNLPGDSTQTVDAGMGADDLETFYLATPGLFVATITYDMEVVLAGEPPAETVQPVSETLNMVIDDFSKTLSSRIGPPLYQVSISLQEV